MGKVQVLAVLSMDGCLASELHGKSYKELRLDCCGINEIKENALYHITPDYSISMLDEWRKYETDTYSGAYPFTFRQPIKHKNSL